ncbi:MAG: Fe-S cluster assembly protein HesB [Armatimonadetes bacterium CG_4_10_14_3_um_filter_66_18]|nr:Fe-S cluster assembly protein HesB [Armatimonadota bacterium]PIW12779.1 MAG: Fe-S cluster assembly protein HesB [Armatimonadetes bacterium CG17_big_fil_post_rev_8_21_14_2_50_66_6]PIX47949.1 MAG: Fe-S cluster assembly protein HesB [Armatimonadetes bacterium CG_4_8_14_3_um_filter_66_20]PIY42918.1 MAG: Fe-S cluster assembly protein HesB [Armatimonadetes bacterium CG_4_10_14_3_um_filter_66_18]NCO91517.1 Fe-S cluster assembly protein HesB [Armatimonadota bacterium]
MSTPTPEPQRLFDLYRRLRDHFGYAPDWWPGSPFDIFVTAVLVQQCDWATAWEALGRLHESGLSSLDDLAAADEDTLADTIRPVAFHATKAERLRSLCRYVVRRHGSVANLLARNRETPVVRGELLSLPGIGEETADAMLSFAGQHPRFVVDAYARRAFMRIGGFGGDRDWWFRAPYHELHDLFYDAIRAELPRYGRCGLNSQAPGFTAALRDVHAQLTELGKHHCLKSAPRCRGQGVAGWKGYFHCVDHCRDGACTECPLWEVCETGRGAA